MSSLLSALLAWASWSNAPDVFVNNRRFLGEQIHRDVSDVDDPVDGPTDLAWHTSRNASRRLDMKSGWDVDYHASQLEAYKICIRNIDKQQLRAYMAFKIVPEDHDGTSWTGWYFSSNEDLQLDSFGDNHCKDLRNLGLPEGTKFKVIVKARKCQGVPLGGPIVGGGWTCPPSLMTPWRSGWKGPKERQLDGFTFKSTGVERQLTCYRQGHIKKPHCRIWVPGSENQR